MTGERIQHMVNQRHNYQAAVPTPALEETTT